MKHLKVRITENRKIAQDFCKMRIGSIYLAKTIRPGQFVEVRCSDSLKPFLRRPFSVHRILNDGIEILYEVVGEGTETLSRRKKGEHLDVIGPLGSGFKVTERETRDERRGTIILVAGGIGVAPLIALAEDLVVRRSSFVVRKAIYVLIGAKTNSHILCEKDFRRLGCKTFISTDDGSRDCKGFVTDVLKRLLNQQTSKPANQQTIYACGPVDMLKEVADIAGARHIPCQVSLEERMACGVGVCLGCPVKIRTAYCVQRTAREKNLTQYAVRSTQYEYKMVCKDGPVFNAEEIIW